MLPSFIGGTFFHYDELKKMNGFLLKKNERSWWNNTDIEHFWRVNNLASLTHTLCNFVTSSARWMGVFCCAVSFYHLLLRFLIVPTFITQIYVENVYLFRIEMFKQIVLYYEFYRSLFIEFIVSVITFCKQVFFNTVFGRVQTSGVLTFRHRRE